MELLDRFWESETIDEGTIDAAEEYLLSVLKAKYITFKTFDDYRYHQHIKCNTPIQLLVPSSYCIHNGHIMWMFYLIRRLSSLLDSYFVPMDPQDYGWKVNYGFLFPNNSFVNYQNI